MTENKNITKKELLQLVADRLKEGISKQELFDELTESLSSGNLHKDSIPKTIALFPDARLKIKFHKSNTLLFILLLLTAVLKVIGGVQLLMDLQFIGLILLLLLPLLNIWFAFEVKKHRAYIYKIVGIMALAGVFSSLGNFDTSGIWVIVDVILLGTISFLGFRLGKRMFPNYKLSGPTKDSDGNWNL
jgi:hypothetical protein